MDQDWKEYAANDSYASTMTSMADVARYFSNAVFIFNAFVAFFLSIGEHLLQTKNNADNRIDNSSQAGPRELPIKVELPFDVSTSPIFECFLIGEFFYDLVIACIVGLVNVLLVTLVYVYV